MSTSHLEAQVVALREDVDHLMVCIAIISATLDEVANVLDHAVTTMRGAARLLVEKQTGEEDEDPGALA